MTTLKSMNNYIDLRSLGLFGAILSLKWLNSFHGISVGIVLGFISVKFLLDFISSALTISTVLYNAVKFLNEGKKFIQSLRGKKKEKSSAADLFTDDEEPKP